MLGDQERDDAGGEQPRQNRVLELGPDTHRGATSRTSARGATLPARSFHPCMPVHAHVRIRSATAKSTPSCKVPCGAPDDMEIRGAFFRMRNRRRISEGRRKEEEGRRKEE